MNFKKSVLSTTVISALGLSGAAALMPSTASAAGIADGNYLAVINVTPTFSTGSYGGTAFKFGKDGAWNSSFSLGFNAPQTGSQGMTDNNTNITVTTASSSSDAVGTPAGTRGSSMLGNGAGSFNISLSGGSFTASNFQMDAIFGTCCGTLVQYGSIAGGTVTGTGGMTLDPTGRLAAFSGGFPSPGNWHDRPWNVNDYNSLAGGGTVFACDNVVGAVCLSNGNTVYRIFTTGASAHSNTLTNTGTSFINQGAITGHEAVTIGDVNSDGIMDYNLILVSASHVGSTFGGLFGAADIEAWNINLLSQVPIPATAWLFGSGLMGLAAFARRKKKA
jgi:hypothetical protein